MHPEEALHHPPSHWFGFRSEDVSELLGWVSVIALALAIWQLFVTARAARAASSAARAAVLHIERFDVVLQLVTTFDLPMEYQTSFGRIRRCR